MTKKLSVAIEREVMARIAAGETIRKISASLIADRGLKVSHQAIAQLAKRRGVGSRAKAGASDRQHAGRATETQRDGNALAAEWVPVGDLTPWPDNPRYNVAAVDKVAASIKRFGFAAPLVARMADRMIIAGHTRFEAAKKLGLLKVPVRLVDLDPAEARLLALADNRLGEIAEWDDDKLTNVLRELRTDGVDLSASGFDDAAVTKLLADVTKEGKAEKERVSFEVDVDGFAFAHKCPRCQFEFNDPS